MKNIYVYILVLSTLTFSCKKAHVTEVRPLASDYADTTKVLCIEDKYPCMKLITDKAVHLKVSEEKVEYNMLNDSVIKMKTRYIPLETKEECLIGSIHKLESDDSSIFIFDRNNGSALRFSQKDGSFLCRYGAKGRGPGEYVTLAEMSVNKKKKEVCLIDFDQYKLMFFNYDGVLLREEPLYYGFSRIEFFENTMILHTHHSDNTMAPSINNNRLVLAQFDQTPLYVGFSFPKSLNQFSQGEKHCFITCKDEVYYNHVLSDTIWQIKENGTCEARYVFKFSGRDNLFDEKDFQTITNEEYEQKTKDVPYYRDNIIITENFIRARINKATQLLYCISTGHYIYGEPCRAIFGYWQPFYADFSLNGTSLVRVLQPFEIIKNHQFIKENFNEYQYSLYWKNDVTAEERLLFQKMTAEDNPILMIMDIEPF